MKFVVKALTGSMAASVMVGGVQAGHFIEDSSLDIKLRNVYFNEMGRSVENEKDRREWVQAVMVDYKSGYFMDRFGFDFSAGSALGLSDEMEGGSSTRCKATHLPIDGNDVGKCDTNDIGGVHQAYAKFKSKSEAITLHANFGKKKRGYKIYSDSGSRALPAASYGFDADIDLYGFGVYAANITGFSPRNQSYFEDDLTNSAGEQIDYLRIFGASYRFDFGLDLNAEFNRSDDYLKQKYFEVRYLVPLSGGMELDLLGRYAEQEEDGDLYGAAGHESNFYDLIATVRMASLGVQIGYTKVSDGAWDDGNFDQDHGNWTSSASNQFDFNAEDEKTWKAGIDYDFAALGIEGLYAELYYAKGTDGKEGATDLGDEWERGTIISYDFAGALDGLNVEWQNYTNRGFNSDRDEDGNRVYVNYSYRVF